ncbi:glycosyltransferase/CDP-glycerol:poly(glycerophosphate) glycerophosphotransferase [Brachyspira pilosicoli B2904]|uniref:Glycosyltransferase/CDP-glycerol:poly(Glycerophosphate) glycerophosphotransferase n=1 Tax=Brachyspira pilosicoli B2904 TaxID=1133568 RepID=J9TPR3_BRAPL|nr:glycosyltransferase family 2 protein [Brachyspira pilosicoli]AFR69392.1 glycosyltransferase/CDP-glycerol:poly(glycerophosphate) glycerophosphotransferase [Brachyspira pilosicoli B2904]
MIKVSVIIPVYNVEEYLKECLDSVINQTLKEIEIICIDDCSTDSSYSILEEYAKKDSRIVLIKNKENMGVGYNRNIGIKEAKGEYIGFIDSDDYISEDYYENLYNTAKKYNSDVVNTLNVSNDKEGNIFNYWCHIDNFVKIKKYYEYESNNLFNNVDFYSKYLVTFNPVNKIFLKKFILDKDIYFIEKKINAAEDADFIIRLFLNSPKVSFNNHSKYFYRINSNSSTSMSYKYLKYNLSAIEYMENTINYCKDKFPSYLNLVYAKVWPSPLYQFYIGSKSLQEEFYPHLYNFAKNIILSCDDFDYKNQYKYDEYILIKSNENYNKYLLNKRIFDRINDLEYKINNLKEDIKKADNWFRLFGINNSKDSLILILFGIKISIKKKNDKDI